jgi:hypothetical protein
MSDLFLQYVNGPKKGKYLNLNQSGETLLGSSDECDIVLSDPMIEDEHLSIVINDGKISLKKVSEKGNVKVEGKSISESDVEEKQNIQVGVLSFRIKGKSQKSMRVKKVDAEEKLSKDIKPIKQNNQELAADNEPKGIGALQEEAPIQKNEGEVIDSLQSNNFLGIVKIAILLFLLFIALYVFRSIKPAEAAPIIMPYKAGELKLMDLMGFLKNAGIRSRPVKVKVSNSNVMRARIYDNSGLNILWFKTIERGDSFVDLYDRNDNLLLRFKYVIKGLKESKVDSLTKLFRSESQRTKRAKDLMKKASIIEKETPHEAMAFYTEALELLTSVSTSNSTYLECRRRMKVPQEVLEERTKKLWQECEDYRKNKEYAEALPFVEKILDLLPDTSSLEHQKALIHKKYILQKI